MRPYNEKTFRLCFGYTKNFEIFTVFFLFYTKSNPPLSSSVPVFYIKSFCFQSYQIKRYRFLLDDVVSTVYRFFTIQILTCQYLDIFMRVCVCLFGMSWTSRKKKNSSVMVLFIHVFFVTFRGWGIRTCDDIPEGAFICIYAGQLLTEQGANEVSHAPCNYVW